MQYKLTTPVTKEMLAPLKAGDTVLLSGTVYTARDAAHKRMMELLDAGQSLPFPVEGSAVYYVGPTPERPGQVIGSAGPTTSGRMDAYSPRLLDLGQAIMIGKGARNQAVKEAVVRNGAVYLAALGGAGALMAASVEELEVICWEDLGCEAVRRLEVKDMPLTVILDGSGNDLYQSGPATYLGWIADHKKKPPNIDL
ncbi:Fe-S-containing hydro-lyase [Flintibacter faecis]|uniref:Fe-S-containing hydro-lyase n=1 Tax=Flintibacter faecis TaxID=2763047 RepID=A0A8J6IYZ7_9FIRM|nr:Fe-S-containing hydro-lyase [Flintibacter faecis]MBC5718225.1 Fe-S-containing hydro-lyase [Flintibacter faecis]